MRKLNADISITELKLAIKSLKCNKAVGIDDLLAEVLKCDNLLDALLALFNKCFATDIIPSAWKQGIINPIPKSYVSLTRFTLGLQRIIFCEFATELGPLIDVRIWSNHGLRS